MAHGGPRPNSGGRREGAGRKPASTTRRTRALADQLAADGGVLPLTVLVERMRALWASKSDDDKREAVQVAGMAAPFLHPRLAAVAPSQARLKLPPLDSFAGIAKAHGVVAKAISAGELDAAAAKDITAMLTSAREALEATAFEARLAALEQHVGDRK